MAAATVRPNHGFADGREYFVFDNALQLTKRELRAMALSPRFWAALLGVGLVLGLVGPFGTYGEMRLAPRIAYWLAMAVSTYFAGSLTVTFLVGLWSPHDRANPLANLIAGAIAGLPVAALAWFLNWFGAAFENPASFLQLLPYCSAIGAITAILVAAFSKQAAIAARTEEALRAQVPRDVAAARPRILDRLPADKRGALQRMTVQDHYVDVHTDRGRTLVLIRLADAIAEAEGVDGLQVHRSHWVARDAIAGVERKDGALRITLKDGSVLPVSRTFATAVREAGLV